MLHHRRETKTTLQSLVASAATNNNQLRELTENVDQLRHHIASINPEESKHVSNLITLQQSAFDMVVQQRVLKGLRFERMHGRYDMVQDAQYNTFRWMLEAREADGNNPSYIRKKDEMRQEFVDWLASSGGVFHFTGKLGSGKSTLMKFLCEHPRTKELLNQWAGKHCFRSHTHRAKHIQPSLSSAARGYLMFHEAYNNITDHKTLIFGNFFFWRPGTPLQRNLAGLRRSLLHTILESSPELTRSLLPDQWEKASSLPWQIDSESRVSDRDIRSAFSKLIDTSNRFSNYCFCFFIDGLDEYEGTTSEDKRFMVDMLQEWAITLPDRLKLCISSREENVFMNAFPTAKRVRLHDLTYQDMEQYISTKLSHWKTQNDPQKGIMIEEMISKSQGIFLWVALVVKSMRGLLENDIGAPIEDMKTMLAELPDDLNSLFRHLLNSISKKERQKAHRIFQILILANNIDERRPLPVWLYALSFLDEYENDNNFILRPQPLDQNTQGTKSVAERVTRVRRNLNFWCKGLVEAVPETVDVSKENAYYEDPDCLWRADFTHRSVPEFFQDAGLRFDCTELRQSADALTHITLASFLLSGSTKRQAAMFSDLLLRIRNEHHLDEPPFAFLQRLAGFVDELLIPWSLYDKRRPVSNPGRVAREIIRSRRRGRDIASKRHRQVAEVPAELILRGKTQEGCILPNYSTLLAVKHDHYHYIRWKIDHDPSSVDSFLKILFIAYGALGFEGLEMKPSAISVLELLLERNMISVNTIADWWPGSFASTGLSLPTDETLNPYLSIWHWYLLSLTWRHAPHSLLTGAREFSKVKHSKHHERLLELFLDYGADTYFVLHAKWTLDANSAFSWDIRLEIRPGDKFPLIQLRDEPNSLGRSPGPWKFPPGEELTFTLRDLIRGFGFSNQERLLSLVERNERLQAEGSRRYEVPGESRAHKEVQSLNTTPGLPAPSDLGRVEKDNREEGSSSKLETFSQLAPSRDKFHWPLPFAIGLIIGLS